MKIGDIKAGIAQYVKEYQNSEPPQKIIGNKGVESAPLEDKVDLSFRGKDISEVKNLLAKLPEVREEKVKAIKESIQQGTYQVDSVKLAERMVRESLIDIFA